MCALTNSCVLVILNHPSSAIGISIQLRLLAASAAADEAVADQDSVHLGPTAR